MKKNNILNAGFLVIILFGVFLNSCISFDDEIKPENADSNSILYNIGDSLTNRIIMDSIIGDKTNPIRHCVINYRRDTLLVYFIYLDDDIYPLNDEIIKRTNRFLKIENEKIPIIFNTDFYYVEEDSTMLAEARSYGYNWMNYAIIKLYPISTLVSYENFYFRDGKETSEKGRKERLEREKLEKKNEKLIIKDQ